MLNNAVADQRASAPAIFVVGSSEATSSQEVRLVARAVAVAAGATVITYAPMARHPLIVLGKVGGSKSGLADAAA